MFVSLIHNFDVSELWFLANGQVYSTGSCNQMTSLGNISFGIDIEVVITTRMQMDETRSKEHILGKKHYMWKFGTLKVLRFIAVSLDANEYTHSPMP